MLGRAFTRPRELDAKNHEYASRRSLSTGAREDTDNSPMKANKTSNEGPRKVRDKSPGGSTVEIPFKIRAQRVRFVSLASTIVEPTIHFKENGKTQQFWRDRRGRGLVSANPIKAGDGHKEG